MISFPLAVTAVDGTEYKVCVWNGEFLGTTLAADSETTLAPFYTRDHRLVAFQAYSSGDTIYLVRKRSLQRFFNVHANSALVWQNAPFDIQVLMHELPRELLLSYYDRNLIYDTKILYTLLQLAVVGQTPQRSDASLKAMYKQMFALDIDKNNAVRTTFDQFLGKEYEEMSVEHAGYAALDVVYTMQLFNRLMDLIKPHDKMGTLLTAHIQVKGDLVLSQCHINGIGVDLEAKNKLAQELEKEISNIGDRLYTWGIVRGKPGINDQYERVIKRLGLEPKLPKTDSGKISSKGSDLEPYQYIPFINDYVNMNTYEKLLSFLVNLNDPVMHPSYTTILNTGRTATQKGHNGMSIHQIPKVGGIREIMIPKQKDHVFIDTDYSTIELAGLSQVLLNLYGSSRMAELINEGKDLHIATAVSVYKKPENEITKAERAFCKIPNFAYPTNMAPSTFVEYCKQYKVSVNEDESANIKEAWLDAYPEMRKYFSEPNGKEDGRTLEGRTTYEHYTITGRKRARCTYTAYLNTHFQGLCADGLKIALFNLFKAGYHITTEIHDQILIEVHKDQAEQAKADISRIMIESMAQVIPDVLVSTESQILERFSK